MNSKKGTGIIGIVQGSLCVCRQTLQTELWIIFWLIQGFYICRTRDSAVFDIIYPPWHGILGKIYIDLVVVFFRGISGGYERRGFYICCTGGGGSIDGVHGVSIDDTDTAGIVIITAYINPAVVDRRCAGAVDCFIGRISQKKRVYCVKSAVFLHPDLI